MEGCKNCELHLYGRCPVLNVTECPINELWQRANMVIAESEATIADAEKFIAGMQFNMN